MIEVYASDQFLLHVTLERDNAKNEDDRAGTAELLTALEALTEGWLKPLGVGFQLVHCDPARYFEEVGQPAHPHHFLRSRAALGEVRVWEAFADSVVEDVPEVDHAVVRRSVLRALDQAAPPGAVTALAELQWTAVRALSPVAEPIALVVAGRPVSTVSKLIDGRVWYLGPTLGTAGPPARIRAVNDHFATRIQLEVCWDLWIGHAAGRALLDAGISRVLARAGWARTA
jgi:hypothetical protein